MDNIEYLHSIGAVERVQRETCLAAMEKYGDNHWWELDVPTQVLAYFQAHEPIMLVENFSRFWEAVDALIGQPTINMQYGTEGMKRLLPKIDAAYREYLAQL